MATLRIRSSDARSVVVGLLTCAVLLVAGPRSNVAAQDDAPANPRLGDEVTYVDDDGNEAAIFVVDDVIDPFEDSADDPPRRAHFVLLVLTIENTGEDALEVDPAAVFLQDEDGDLYTAEEDLDLGDEDPLEAADLDAGDDVSGAIGYAVPDSAAALARVFYRPADDRLVLLADLRGGGGGEAPAVADGTWEGETEEGGAFSFVVDGGRVTSIVANYSCPDDNANTEVTLTPDVPLAIEGGAFTLRISAGTFSVAVFGTFTAEDEAEGTVEVDNPGEDCDLTLAWTASPA